MARFCSTPCGFAIGTTLLASIVLGQENWTCGSLKQLYKDAQCCGMPNKQVNASFKGNSAGGCQDLPGWKDSDGDKCAAIVKQGVCKYSDDYESSYGTEGAKAGAKQACCGCGGGMRTSNGRLQKCVDYDKATNEDLRTQDITKKGHCYEDTERRGKQFRKSIKKGKMLFFGDSDIEYWKSEEKFPNAINCGVGGSTAYEAQMHAEQTAKKFKPKGHVVIVAGENDMNSAVECAETIFNNVKKAVSAFMHSRYYPTVIMFSTKPEPGTTNLHSLYRKYDAMCQAMADSKQMKGHFKFVHAHNRFLEMDNPRSLYDSDDLHLSKKGYEHWNTWLQEVVKEGCHDFRGDDGKEWKDSGGDTCSTISEEDWCSEYDDYKVDGVGANRACCECGGGCDDFPQWKDSDGDDCNSIVKGEMCDDADDYKVDGVGAKQACCGCGGGTKRMPLL